MTDASQNSPRSVSNRALMQRIGLSDDALPAGGNWYPEDKALEAVLDLIDAMIPRRILMLGGRLSIAVLARATREHAEIWLIEHDPQIIEISQALLARTGDHAPVHITEAELQEYDKHNLWYDRHVLGGIPGDIDLIYVDGPPHFCGRTPRYPAGPELFRLLSAHGRVVLDKAQRVKEKKALARWETEFPHLGQSRLKRGGGAVVLSAKKS